MEAGKSIKSACFRGHEPRRLRRALILTELKGICLKIGRMQSSPEGRLACREVAKLLDETLARENISSMGRRR